MNDDNLHTFYQSHLSIPLPLRGINVGCSLCRSGMKLFDDDADDVMACAASLVSIFSTF
jgi:hypothetical protein